MIIKKLKKNQKGGSLLCPSDITPDSELGQLIQLLKNAPLNISEIKKKLETLKNDDVIAMPTELNEFNESFKKYLEEFNNNPTILNLKIGINNYIRSIDSGVASVVDTVSTAVPEATEALGTIGGGKKTVKKTVKKKSKRVSKKKSVKNKRKNSKNLKGGSKKTSKKTSRKTSKKTSRKTSKKTSRKTSRKTSKKTSRKSSKK